MHTTTRGDTLPREALVEMPVVKTASNLGAPNATFSPMYVSGGRKRVILAPAS